MSPVIRTARQHWKRRNILSNRATIQDGTRGPATTRVSNISASPRVSGRFFLCLSGIGSSRSRSSSVPSSFGIGYPSEWSTPGDRIALVFKCAAFALLPGIIGICVVSAQRLDPKMWVGRMAKPNSALDINTRFILNTFEQFAAYLVAIAVVALYSPAEEARALPILTLLFLLGRILFWIGYHKNPYLRAFGFGLTFYPTVAVYIWYVLFIVFGLRIPLF